MVQFKNLGTVSYSPSIATMAVWSSTFSSKIFLRRGLKIPNIVYNKITNPSVSYVTMTSAALWCSK